MNSIKTETEWRDSIYKSGLCNCEFRQTFVWKPDKTRSVALISCLKIQQDFPSSWSWDQVRSGHFHRQVLWYTCGNSPIAQYEISFFKADLIAGILNNLVRVESAPQHDGCLVSDLTRVLKMHDAFYGHTLHSKSVPVAWFPVGHLSHVPTPSWDAIQVCNSSITPDPVAWFP